VNGCCIAHPGEERWRSRASLHPHEALFYCDESEYVDGLRRFFAPAIAAGEPVAAALPRSKFDLARQALEGASDYELLDMQELGRNPGRIIPAVESMIGKHAGRTLHYVGEPIWPGRSPAEICEAVRHEALINVAWPQASVRVLCPYDARGLDEEVLRSAERTHPTLDFGGEQAGSPSYRVAPPPECNPPLPAPPPRAATLEFGPSDLAAVRALAAEEGVRSGVTTQRLHDLKLIANELASNAIQHGGPPMVISVWPDSSRILCEVSNQGCIDDPLAGRRNPIPNEPGGMGLWIVNQLSELVEVRTGERTTVRAHLSAC
jgi:anti-sigma regulatory factor (Ser/Thr protein kinase)